MSRPDGRDPHDMRDVNLTPGYMPYAEGSCFVEMGDTKVLCSATVDEGVPRWLMGKGLGWLSAEYAMIPRSSPERIQREVNKGRQSGRTAEIQRLIGRGVRAAVDMKLLGERTIWLDCDVIQADGGTRTASITGAFVALAQACEWMRSKDMIEAWPLIDSVSAISVGIIDGVTCLDLTYVEDSNAQVDMNIVMTGAGKLVEVQGTAEHGAFERSDLDNMIDLATKGIVQLTAKQEMALGAPEAD